MPGIGEHNRLHPKVTAILCSPPYIRFARACQTENALWPGARDDKTAKALATDRAPYDAAAQLLEEVTEAQSARWINDPVVQVPRPFAAHRPAGRS